ncbi:MAG: helix-turn-helix transcriptional regulator [Lachnospiraceae bacterium]|nr:helix-turn-helix transcriptional regulator [Lachnospiraceae bacterium]
MTNEGIGSIICLQRNTSVFLNGKGHVMAPCIDKESTGNRIELLMKLRGITVQDVKAYLSLGCVQSVYHWLEGRSLPSVDNLYALSELLQVPMDLLICGNRKDVSPPRRQQAERMLCYSLKLTKGKAA